MRKSDRRTGLREALVAALVLAVAAGLTAAAGAADFDDVHEMDVHAPAIEALATDGILGGTACVAGDLKDGVVDIRLFCPYDPIKRWVMAVWLGRALGAEMDMETRTSSARSAPFADVSDDEWWAPYVARLASVGVIKGCDTEPARYCPQGTVTRAQMASFLSRAYGLPTTMEDGGFTDIGGNVHADNINALAAAAITVGCETEPARYCPGDDVTRAQMATFVHRARDLPAVSYFLVPTGDALATPAPPAVSARTWILYDDTFGQVLAEHKPDLQRAMASTTKIMTALVVLDEAELDERVTITKMAADTGESEIGLVAHEDPWTVQELLAALLLRSANDAAVALADHVGGSVEGFADLMNMKAAELGLENTHFVNPHGLDSRAHYSSARDLLTLALAAMEDQRFARLVQARSVNLPATPGGHPRPGTNRNRLLAEYPGAIGLKTGFTSNAILTMVAAAERDGRRLYTVVMGSTDHYGDATALLDYGFTEFAAMTLTRPPEPATAIFH